uniref:Uncharacterized protein n=1 Tax=Alexandrium monilatum TaxID=311494 RepID=A0A7S4QM01_9DINO|mmetsp:Transcript_70744/g.218509  ORF Transcript_70744/g.218509 Transcript_70744/m.218509 type:complete len:308 (+) Transcript_70744:74-997(+)
MAVFEVENWTVILPVFASAALLMLVGIYLVEVRWAVPSHVTYKFLEAHQSVESIQSAISDHWGQLGVVGTLFLSSTLIAAQNVNIQKHKDEYPVTVSSYVALTTTAASLYATAVFLCIVHRTATAGLSRVGMTKYVLSMPHCIGGPLVLNVTAWVMADIGTTLGFFLNQNISASVYIFLAQLACWIVIAYTGRWAFAVHKEPDDTTAIEEQWQFIHEGQTADSDSEAEMERPESKGWTKVTHTLVEEIAKLQEEDQRQAEFGAKLRGFLDHKHADVLARLQQPDGTRDSQAVLQDFHTLHIARQLAG